MKNVLATVAILMIGFCVKFGLNMIDAEPYTEPSAADEAEWAAEDDTWIAESLQSGTAAPARGWLDGADHVSFEGPPDLMNELIEKLHAAGAEQVWMVDIAEFGGKQISDTIAVELPAPGPGRDAIFALEAELWDGEGRGDVGQRYLALSFD